jgi:Family of unknown function (DUF5906)/CHC2 zinc finger
MEISEAKTALPLPELMRLLGFPAPDRDRFKIKCPLHGEQNGESFSAERKNGAWLWKCFGKCNRGGDEISFLEAHENLSRCAAINRFIKLAGGPASGTPRTRKKPVDLFAPASTAAPVTGNSSSTSEGFNWQSCVSALRPGSEERIARERGFSTELVSEIHKKGLIGSYKGHIAFPVQDNGQAIGVHYKVGKGWFYHPKGTKTRPFIIGELVPGKPIHVFESQWDAFAFMDVSGVRHGIIITRGSSNGALVAGLIPAGSPVYAWKQNDEPKNGKRAGDEWLKAVVAHAGSKVLWPKTPEQFKDLNDWTKAGAIRDDLLFAIQNAETVREALAAPASFDDFHAYMPMHSYIFIPARDLWPAASVDARLPLVKTPGGKIKASKWLDQTRPVEMMTWAPGLPMVIKDRLISDGGWIHRPGCTTFNLYRPPNIKLGDAKKAGRWLDHVAMLYPHDKDHIIRWLASRVQRPHVKINHAIYMGGPQGIGKDTLLYPAKHSVGTWNVREILPPTLLGRFNGFTKSVLLCLNESHDLGDLDRYALYERLKAYTVAPPDTIRVDEKNIREYEVFNACGVIITSNYKTGGLYLPADDRRHYVAWSGVERDSIPGQYWKDIYAWYDQEGIRHVAAYLTELDISDFNPKAPPPKTEAFWEIVDSNRAPENAELANALQNIDNPDAVTVKMVVDALPDTEEFRYWLKDRKNSRQVPHRFEEVGYVAVRNPGEGEGRWKIGRNSYVVYAKKTLSRRDQIIAVQKCIEQIKPLYP